MNNVTFQNLYPFPQSNRHFVQVCLTWQQIFDSMLPFLSVLTKSRLRVECKTDVF